MEGELLEEGWLEAASAVEARIALQAAASTLKEAIQEAEVLAASGLQEEDEAPVKPKVRSVALIQRKRPLDSGRPVTLGSFGSDSVCVTPNPLPRMAQLSRT